MVDYRIPTVGVEEEYQLVEPETGYLSPKGRAVLKLAKDQTRSSIQHELHLEQIEMASPILHSTEEVRECLLETRRTLVNSAKEVGTSLVSAATNPLDLPHHVLVTPKRRYTEMVRKYQSLARELVIFGCHVHVDMPDREVGIQVVNAIRGWLPLLQAVSANSPYWHGEDTGYASYRREVWVQWPLSGIPHYFESLEDYKDCIHALVQAEAIDDETKIYWDARLPAKLPTLEFRVYDVQTEIEDSVALVTISRALTMKCEKQVRDGVVFPNVRHEILRAAIWRAARFGVSEKLIDPFESTLIDAFAHIQSLVDFIDEPLRELGDRDLVHEYVARLKSAGSPAERQRAVLKQSGADLHQLVRYLAERTLPG